MAEDHGTYYSSMTQGRTFYGSTGDGGVVLTVPAQSGNHPTLWNPPDSGVNLSLIRLELGYVSGVIAPSALEWASCAVRNIASHTLATPLPCLVGSGFTSRAKWAPAANTFTAAPDFARSTGLSLFSAAANTAAAPFKLIANYDGDFGVAPGFAISLCSQANTTTAYFQVTVVWEEVTA